MGDLSNTKELRKEANKLSPQKAAFPSWKPGTRETQARTKRTVPERNQETIRHKVSNERLFLKGFNLQYLWFYHLKTCLYFTQKIYLLMNYSSASLKVVPGHSSTGDLITQIREPL